VLYSPAGSSFQLGSYVIYENPGPDFGETGLMVPRFAINPAVEGGVRTHREIGIRRFTIPMRVASSAAYTDAQALSLIRLYADKGGYIDIQNEGMASSESVRFDIEDGRFELSYNPFLNRIDRQAGNLLLDVQPYGYWPTMILLASAASVGLPGTLAISGAGSIFGDVPGLAQVEITPTVATVYPSYGTSTWVSDMIAWSLGARASFTARLHGGSLLGVAAWGTASIVGDQYATGSQAMEMAVGGRSTFGISGGFVIPSALEPAFRGRHHVFALVNIRPSQGFPVFMSADVAAAGEANPPRIAMGSAAPVATIWAHGDWVNSSLGTPSPAYQIADLGEITIPPVASGRQAQQTIRLWTKPATTTLIPTQYMRVDSIYLLPVDAPAGVAARRIKVASWALDIGPSQPKLEFNAIAGENRLWDVAASQPFGPIANYNGLPPRVGASTLQLDLLGGQRRRNAVSVAGQEDPLVRGGNAFAAVGLSYRPRFTFIKGF
jgi:hypothetical protein